MLSKTLNRSTINPDSHVNSIAIAWVFLLQKPERRHAKT